MPTIRELAAVKLKECGDIESLGPHRAAELLVELSSLLASTSKECVDRKSWYAILKMNLLKEHGTASKANIYAEASEEFKQYLEAEELRKVIIEAQRSIKYYLRVNEEERRNQNY